uniref:Reverse transcriptase domain-containing protein n=1 Tax=Chrysemys picta bellii TaxID=8478 RepID=A0A8C3PGK1_CHRPI
MGYYGIPAKIIRITKGLCDNTKCAVTDGDNISQWFAVTTGVRQGCIMSPLLFALVIEYVMRKVTIRKQQRNFRDRC